MSVWTQLNGERDNVLVSSSRLWVWLGGEGMEAGLEGVNYGESEKRIGGGLPGTYGEGDELGLFLIDISGEIVTNEFGRAIDGVGDGEYLPM